MWSKTTKTCKKSCDLRSNTDCASEKMCENDDATQQFEKTCVNRYENEDLCRKDFSCMWNALKGQCSKTCSSISLEKACGVESMCEWREGQCQKLCIHRWNSTQAQQCTADEECQFDAASKECRNTCDRLTIDKQCNADKLCEFSA